MAGEAGSRLMAAMLTSQTCFDPLLPSAALVEIQSPQRREVMGNFVSRCLAEFRRLFTSHPTKSNPDRVVATNIDRESKIKAIRVKIQSLKEEDMKQTNILDYLNSDSFKDRVSQKILSVTLGNLDEKLGDYDGNQESCIKRLKEEQAMLIREDKRVQAELESAESETHRLEEVLRQKQLDLQELRERVRQQ